MTAPSSYIQQDYNLQLNEAQRAAIQKTEGPLLILAGAGTGKTRVLTMRMAHILREGLAQPDEILAVTFTNKAAGEMRERVRSAIEVDWRRNWLGTFHSISARMLRREAEWVGLDSNFTIIDQDDQLRLIKQLLSEMDLDPKAVPPKSVLAQIERWKNKGLLPCKVPPSDASQILELYERYQTRLKRANCCDFGDLLLYMIEIFQNNPQLLDYYQRKFKYLMVDEYQDTNVAQYLWLRLLASGHRNICCVGDDDQSIYGWRGAEIDNILRFEQDFVGAEIIRLEENYRSTGTILKVASALIEHNEDRLGKMLWTKGDEGQKPVLRGLWDGQEEARWVAQEISKRLHMGLSLSDMAILVRAGFQTREFEEKFIALNIPYRIIGSLKFYERMEIRDVLAYLRLLVQPKDDLAFERIINVPKRGIGPGALRQIREVETSFGLACLPAIQRVLEENPTIFKPKLRESLSVFVSQFQSWQTLLSKEEPAELAERILEESGYLNFWRREKTLEADGRLENIKELLNTIGTFDSLFHFLEHISLVMDRIETEGEEAVSLMTMHAAKGLEFNTVFLPGWEEELFPSKKAVEEKGLKGIEEERRLAYVALTRARKEVLISYASNRRIHGNWIQSVPSLFIKELPEEWIEPILDRTQNYHASHVRGAVFPHRLKDKLKRAASSDNFSIGDRIFHEKFGYGHICKIDGMRLEIAFEQTGRKKIMQQFVKKA